MAIGEGGGELEKQLLCDTYDIKYPGVVAVYLEGAPNPGVGPQDIALAIIGAVSTCTACNNSLRCPQPAVFYFISQAEIKICISSQLCRLFLNASKISPRFAFSSSIS